MVSDMPPHWAKASQSRWQGISFTTLHSDQQLSQSCLTQLFTTWEREQMNVTSPYFPKIVNRSTVWNNLFERKISNVRGKQGNIADSKCEKVVQNRSHYLGILDIPLQYSSPPSINNGISLKVWPLKAKLNLCECFLPFSHSSMIFSFL